MVFPTFTRQTLILTTCICSVQSSIRKTSTDLNLNHDWFEPFLHRIKCNKYELICQPTHQHGQTTLTNTHHISYTSKHAMPMITSQTLKSTNPATVSYQNIRCRNPTTAPTLQNKDFAKATQIALETTPRYHITQPVPFVSRRWWFTSSRFWNGNFSNAHDNVLDVDADDLQSDCPQRHGGHCSRASTSMHRYATLLACWQWIHCGLCPQHWLLLKCMTSHSGWTQCINSAATIYDSESWLPCLWEMRSASVTI